jgi:hypothetical protein
MRRVLRDAFGVLLMLVTFSILVFSLFLVVGNVRGWKAVAHALWMVPYFVVVGAVHVAQGVWHWRRTESRR